MMHFCDSCGSMVVQIGQKTRCLACGKEKEGKIHLSTTEKNSGIAPVIQSITEIRAKALPKIEKSCPRCQSQYAYVEHLHNKAGAKLNTAIVTCVGCGYKIEEEGISSTI